MGCQWKRENKMSTTEGTLPESKKQCDWCREEIRVDAVKCPHCHKWRKDIQEDLNNHRRWAVAFISSLSGCAITCAVSYRRGIWTESLSWLDRGHFSFGKFIGSFQGWFVLFLIAGVIMSLVNTNRYSKRMIRKTGSHLSEF